MGGIEVVLTDRKGRVRHALVETAEVEEEGPVRTTRRLAGRFPGCRGLEFYARLSSYTNTGLMCLRFTLRNTRRARHPGGLWDLGDPGSVLFRDLSLVLRRDNSTGGSVLWQREPGIAPEVVKGHSLKIYQDSSGGQQWQSRNHVNRHGRVPCRFQGYCVSTAAGDEFGRRASPVVVWEKKGTGTSRCSEPVPFFSRVAVSVPEFWQQFPKAIEVNERGVRVGLFPAEWGDEFELQGGEQKTHTVWFRFGEEPFHDRRPSPPTPLPQTGDGSFGTASTEPAGEGSFAEGLQWTHAPARVSATPEWYEASGAVPYLSAASCDADDRLRKYLDESLVGEKGLLAGREVIDEYGWRNYGDVWANHEEAYYQGPKPVISHYNNQFDVVNGGILQMMRTGDPRWFDLFAPLARHVIDIDIYHTAEDRSAYSGGLFWFTDHYLDAATSTHRTYSRANRPKDGRPYGGGPGSEHNFTTGLLNYYYLTGDRDARDAVLGLADWVLRMEDGSATLLGLLDDGPTGLASFGGTAKAAWPGRAAANSIRVLLDAWELSERPCYLAKAWELIHRCIHPADDVASFHLLEAEHHWSYTMFLSSLAHYLDLMEERGQVDEEYGYVQRSLVRWATWMLENERPCLDHPEKLEYPTEAWAVQEFRKANVLRLAAQHVDTDLGQAMLRRGEELADRAWRDLLGFETRYYARAVAIVMNEGVQDAWFHVRPLRTAAIGPPPREPERREAFVPQKTRVLRRLRTPAGLRGAGVQLLRPGFWRRAMRYCQGRRTCERP